MKVLYEPIAEAIIVPHGIVVEANGKRYTSGQRLPKDSVVTYISDDKVAKKIGLKKPKAEPIAPKGGDS